jgi:hypothetical protein
MKDLSILLEQGSEVCNLFLKFSVFRTESYRNLYSLQPT